MSAAPQVEGASGGSATGEAVATSPDRAGLGYYCHTGTLTLYQHGYAHTPTPVQKGYCSLTGLPIYAPTKGFAGTAGVTGRGTIRTMSSKAAGRLRHWLLTHHCHEAELYDVTLTIPGEITPEEWDRTKRRLWKRWERAGFGVVWRVELQKRKMPHLHCVVWVPKALPEEEKGRQLRWAWMECLPEANRNHFGAWQHAVHVKGPYTDIEQSPKWLAYVAAHASKRKKEQLGWKGKQWGIINRERFSEREAMVSMTLSKAEETKFNRTLSRYYFSLSRAHRMRLRRKGIKPRARLRRMFFPAGCKRTRLVDPSVVVRILEHIKGSSILAKPLTPAARLAATTEPPPPVC